jgi:2'-5' RNA ligase
LCRGGLERARWVDPEDYHVTLRFIGDVDETLALRVADELAGIEAEPFEGRLSGFGSFGGEKPRSVHLRVLPSDPLRALHERCERACRKAGLEPEGRKFVPHVTIARLNGRHPEAVARWLDGRSYVGPTSFRAESFGLYTARPGGGAPYDVAVRYDLSG